MNILEALFGSGAQLSWEQECARGVVVFLYGLIAVRIAGRRVFGKWAALDIIVSIIIGSNLSRALTGSAALGGTLAATTLLLALHWCLAKGAVRSKTLSMLVEGRPFELAREGHVDRNALQRWSITSADLDEALRQSGLDEPRQTRLIVLEPSGKISIMKPDQGR